MKKINQKKVEECLIYKLNLVLKACLISQEYEIKAFTILKFLQNNTKNSIKDGLMMNLFTFVKILLQYLEKTQYR